MSDADTPPAATDEAAKYAQALRFLISLQSQQNQDTEAQRNFLRSKGLSDPMIERAFQEARRPETLAQDGLVSSSNAAAAAATKGLSDADAFDRAAKMFDDPLHADEQDQGPTRESYAQQQSNAAVPSLPPKSYPRSPLALYQQQSTATASSIDNPLTRYHVLLRFFRSLCYFLVLGGGLTGVAVGLYRAYLMPRLIGTLDARSELLKHHRELYSTLTGRINGLRNNSLAPASVQELQNGVSPLPRKGVLKRVQFADEVAKSKGGDEKAEAKAAVAADGHQADEEDKKQAGELKRSVSAIEGKPEYSQEEKASLASVEQGVDKESKAEGALAPIDILESWRASLARLNQTLKADMSAAAVGSNVDADTTQTPTGTAAKSSSALAATVEDESDAESWVSEEDSDELEFDPFAPPSTKSKTKRKHTPKSSESTAPRNMASAATSTLSDRPTAAGTSASSLKSTLNGMNAYLNTQTYMANANVFGSRSLGFSSIGGSVSSGGSAGGESNQPKAGEVGQVRAEIRSLKGLLLSRRNFPIYSRPTAPRVEPAA